MIDARTVRFVTHKDQVFTYVADQRCVGYFTMPRHHDLRLPRKKRIEDFDPALAVHVHVERREVRQDRKTARLDEVASEEDPFIDDHRLIANGVRRPHVA